MISPEECLARIRRGGWTEDRLLGRCSFPVGPRNTWSNLAYLLAGWCAWLLEPRHGGLLFALAMSLLALGSALYHGFKTRLGNGLDWAGMYASTVVLIGLAIDPQVHLLKLGGTALFGALAGLVSSNLRFDWAMALGVGLVTALAAWRGNGLLAAAGAALFILAWFAWSLDHQEASPLGRWGHALWHIGAGSALGLLYLALP